MNREIERLVNADRVEDLISVFGSFDENMVWTTDDERYTDLVGKTCILPIMNKEIPIIADSFVEKDFGTGAVKITPAHDPNDYELGLRHNLEVISVIGEDGSRENSVL